MLAECPGPQMNINNEIMRVGVKLGQYIFYGLYIQDSINYITFLQKTIECLKRTN
jgi:hypothetical protein